mgnify:CR=1 FL=1|tara:strand:+ start:20 stop:2365 length:2346 start_codon:yes stop_codon:yes gene_type:complete
MSKSINKIDFLKDNKIPFIMMNLEIKEGKKNISDVPMGWTKWDFEKCMNYNNNIKKSTNALNINLSKSKFMIIDIDSDELKEKYLNEYGSEFMTKSTRKKLPHLWRLKDENDKNTTKTSFKDGLDLLYQNVFEWKKENIENYNDKFLVFKDYPKNISKKINMNKSSKKIIKKAQLKKTEINTDNELNEICNLIDIKYLDNYYDWLRIVWALKFLDQKQIAIDISKKSKKYTEEGFMNVWDNHKYDGITKSTLYYYSKKSNIKEFQNIISKYYLDFTDDNFALTFIRSQTENLVYKDGEVYIYIKNTWYKQDKDFNQLQAIITKELTKILEFKILEISKFIGKLSQDDNLDKDKIDKETKKRDEYLKMLKNVKSATGSKNICKKVIHQLSIMDFKNVIFDNLPDILPFDTQYYDLDSNKLYNYTANKYILSKLTYDYKKSTNEELKKIDNLFNQIFTNENIRNDYKQILSSSLFGRPVDKFIVANGDGGNGKSVLHELLVEALEEKTFAYIAPVSVILNKVKQGSNPEVANMNKKRLVLYREPSDNELLDIGTLKELTGSKTINARMNYSNQTITLLHATHILEANKKPKMKGEMDNSIYRRLIDINFNSTFTFDEEQIKECPELFFKADPYLRTQEFKDKFKIPLLNYLINYITNFNKENNNKVYEEFKMSDETINRTKEYICNSDFVATFVKENTEKVKDSKKFIQLKDLHSIMKCSEEYLNMNKEEKRKYNLKYFKENIIKNGFFKKYYKDKINFIDEDGNRTTARSVLINFQIKEEEE